MGRKHEGYNKQRGTECEWFVSNNHYEAVLNIQMMVTVELGGTSMRENIWIAL